MSNNRHAWLVITVAAFFFFYEFLQMNIFNAIASSLMQAFHINATTLSRMSSIYFIANVIFLFPAGILLDRYSIRRIILIALGLCIIGTACFALTSSLAWATVFRFLMGIGSAFCFLSCIRLATYWFPSDRLGIVTGFIVTIAVMGGVVAQTPLTLLVAAVEWRTALLIDAGFGILVWFAIACFVRDYPENKRNQYHEERHQHQTLYYWQRFKHAFLHLPNWLAGAYTSLMNVPLSLLGGIWGILYLTTTQRLTDVKASYVTTALFFGMIIGCPLIGAISDRLNLRKLPMLCGAMISFFIIGLIFFVPNHSFIALLISFLALGMVTSTQILSYPTVAESSPAAITAMSVSTVSITTQFGQAIFQPIFGWLMDWHAHRSHTDFAPGVYTSSDFSWAIFLFPIAILGAFLMAVALRETYGKRRNIELE